MSASSFSLYDSAIYIGKKMGSTQVFFDIPVTSTITAGSIDLNIGKVRGQGWVEHTTSYGLSFKAGQFDTIYGFESNDTKDIVFTRQGVVYNNVDPFVHMGLLMTYNFTPSFYANLIVGNHHDWAWRGNVMLEPGLKVGYADSSFRASVGGYVAGNGSGENWYLNNMIGFTAGMLAMDLEVDLKKLEANTAVGYAGMLQAVGTFNDWMSAGVRGEYSKSAVAGVDTQYQITVGPQFKVSDSMTFRTDYNYRSTTAVGATASVEHIVNVSSVVRF